MGLEIVRDREKKEIYVNQAGYISRVLARFGMDQSRGRATPMDKDKIETRENDEPEADQEKYRQAIGSLLYAALGSWPDIVYVVGVCYT